MHKIIVLYGPTASQKSKIAIDISEKFSCEIINADSRQFFKYMEIGTASPTSEDKKMVAHHLYNILNPDEKINAGRFVKMADEKIKEIISRDRIPLIVGGTGLYIKSLLKGIAPIPEIPEQFRKSAKEMIKDKGTAFCYEYLKRNDPEYANKISPADTQRIERALEVLLFTNKGFSQFHRNHKFAENRYEHISICIIPARDLLYERINRRTVEIFKKGIIEETEFLIKNGFIDSHAFNAIGYYEAYKYINNELDLNEAINITAQRTRQYAKRQITWFKHSDGKIFTNIEIIDDILNYIERCLE